MRRSVLVVLCLSFALTDCGSSGGSSSPTAPSGPTRSVILQTTWSLGNFAARRLNVTAPGSGGGNGTLEASVDWTSPSNDVDLVLTDGACVDLNTVGICSGRPCCTVLANADSLTTKPERVSASVAPGAYSVWILNFGPGGESGTVQVVYTR